MDAGVRVEIGGNPGNAMPVQIVGISANNEMLLPNSTGNQAVVREIARSHGDVETHGNEVDHLVVEFDVQINIRKSV